MPIHIHLGSFDENGLVLLTGVKADAWSVGAALLKVHVPVP